MGHRATAWGCECVSSIVWPGTSLNGWSPGAGEPVPSGPSILPYELRVAEALLAETVRQFESRRQRIQLLASGTEESLTFSAQKNTADIYTLLPVQRCQACPEPACACTGPQACMCMRTGTCSFVTPHRVVPSAHTVACSPLGRL